MNIKGKSNQDPSGPGVSDSIKTDDDIQSTKSIESKRNVIKKQVLGNLLGGTNTDGNEGGHEVKGYKNRGNDCFANSSGAVLLNLSKFEALMESYPESALLQEFKKCQSKEDLISIRSLVRSPDGKIDWKIQDQQDAAEFIDAVLQTLMESNTISENKIKETFQVKYQRVSTSNYAAIQVPADPLVESSFLNVPVKSTLDEAFKYMNREDEETQTKGTEIIRTSREYGRSPDVLMIQFSRWMSGTGKIEDPVKIPLNWNPVKIKGNYKLKSAIVHVGGSITSGHYYALIDKNGKYYSVNDNVVLELNCDEFLKRLKYAYLLFYEKTTQDNLDYFADDIANINKTPPSSPTYLRELKRKLMDTNEVKKQQKQDTHCKYCSSNQDRTTLMAHLQSREYCRMLYLRRCRTESLSDVKALELSDPCFACDNAGFKQLSRHLKKSEKCLKEYREHFNVATHEEVMTKMTKLRETMKPSRGKKARHDQNKKENERKRNNISQVDGINSYRENTSLSNYRTCVVCKGNYLESGAKELKDEDRRKLNINSQDIEHLKRMDNFWICSTCFEDKRKEMNFVSPQTMGYKDFSGGRRVFYPIFSEYQDDAEAEADVNRTNANKIISILVPSSVEALKLSKNAKPYQSDSYVLPKITSSNKPVTLEELRSLYAVIYSRYWRKEMFSSAVTTNNYDKIKKILYSVKKKVDVSKIHGSDDWENHNVRNIIHRFDQIGHIGFQIKYKVEKSNIECFATSKIIKGENITIDKQGEANKEQKTIYWLNKENPHQKINLNADFIASDYDNSNQNLFTFVCSLFQRTTNFVQHIVKNQSTELRSDDYFFCPSFDKDGNGFVNGVIWPLSLHDINKELHESSYCNEKLSEKLKQETSDFFAQTLSTSSDKNELQSQHDLTDNEVKDLLKLINTYQIDLQRKDPPLPALKYLWCQRESSNQNIASAETLKIFMRGHLINLSIQEKENLSTLDWITSLLNKEIRLETNNSSIFVHFPKKTVKFFKDDNMMSEIEILRRDELLSEWCDFIGLYHYSQSICNEELVIFKRTKVIECFTNMFNPFVLRAVRSTVAVSPVYGNIPLRFNTLSLANDKNMSNSDAALSALESHSEISLGELFLLTDSQKGKIETNRAVVFVNSSPTRKLVFNKIKKGNRNENSFRCEGNDKEYFDQAFDVVTRHNERLNGQQLLLVETASYYNQLEKEKADMYYEYYYNDLEKIPEDKIYCHKSVMNGKPLPKYILCKNKQVLELRQYRKIVSYPTFEEDTYESRFSRVLLYYPLKPGLDLQTVDIGNLLNLSIIFLIEIVLSRCAI